MNSIDRRDYAQYMMDKIRRQKENIGTGMYIRNICMDKLNS